MAKFMFVYREAPGQDCEEATAEEMQQALQTWLDWIELGKKAGWMLDGGSGLKPAGMVVQPDLTVTDGPFAESKELVGGYSMVEAPDLATACEYAKICPMPATGGSVEVRELAHPDL